MAAVWLDLKSEKINNQLICLGIAGIILKVFLCFGYEQIIESSLGFFIPIVSLFILFYFHMLGAGDIKLLAVAGGFLGIEGSLFCIVVTFLVGAVYAFAKMCIYQLFTERFAYFFHYMKTIFYTKKRVPYYDLSQEQKTIRLHFSIPIAIRVAMYIGRQRIARP